MEIIQGVNMLECTGRSHVYLIQGEESILIDTGFPGLSDKILSEIKTLEIDPRTIKYILLTHHDVDHVGNTKVLQNATGAALWAPDEDVPYIIGEKNRPGIKRVIQNIIRYEKPIVNNKYVDNQRIGELQVIKAPGHTPGHVIFSYKNILFTGDMFKIIDGAIKEMPNRMNWNRVEYKKSLSLLKNLEYEWICPSHGSPIKRNSVWDKFIEKH